MILKHYERATYLAATIVFTFLMGLTLVDVVGRTFFESPLAAANELTEYSLVLVTFLVYPVVALRRQHIVVDLFDHFVGPRVRALQEVLAGLSGAVVFGLLAWRFWMQGARLLQYGDVSPELRIPVAPAFHFMSCLAGITAVAFLLTAFGVGKVVEQGEADVSPGSMPPSGSSDVDRSVTSSVSRAASVAAQS